MNIRVGCKAECACAGLLALGSSAVLFLCCFCAQSAIQARRRVFLVLDGSLLVGPLLMPKGAAGPEIKDRFDNFFA